MPAFLLDPVMASEVLRGYLATDYYKKNKTVKGAPKVAYSMTLLGGTYSFDHKDYMTVNNQQFVAMPPQGTHPPSREPTSHTQVGLCTQYFKYNSGTPPSSAGEIYRAIVGDIVMSWATALAGGQLNPKGLGELGQSLYDIAGSVSDASSANEILSRFNKAWTVGQAQGVDNIASEAQKKVAKDVLALWNATNVGLCRFTYEIAGWEPGHAPSVLLPPSKTPGHNSPVWVDASVWAGEHWDPTKETALQHIDKLLYGIGSHQSGVNFNNLEQYNGFSQLRMKLTLVTKSTIFSDLTFFTWLADGLVATLNKK